MEDIENERRLLILKRQELQAEFEKFEVEKDKYLTQIREEKNKLQQTRQNLEALVTEIQQTEIKPPSPPPSLRLHKSRRSSSPAVVTKYLLQQQRSLIGDEFLAKLPAKARLRKRKSVPTRPLSPENPPVVSEKQSNSNANSNNSHNNNKHRKRNRDINAMENVTDPFSYQLRTRKPNITLEHQKSKENLPRKIISLNTPTRKVPLSRGGDSRLRILVKQDTNLNLNNKDNNAGNNDQISPRIKQKSVAFLDLRKLTGIVGSSPGGGRENKTSPRLDTANSKTTRETKASISPRLEEKPPLTAASRDDKSPRVDIKLEKGERSPRLDTKVVKGDRSPRLESKVVKGDRSPRLENKLNSLSRPRIKEKIALMNQSQIIGSPRRFATDSKADHHKRLLQLSRTTQPRKYAESDNPQKKSKKAPPESSPKKSGSLTPNRIGRLEQVQKNKKRREKIHRKNSDGEEVRKRKLMDETTVVLKISSQLDLTEQFNLIPKDLVVTDNTNIPKQKSKKLETKKIKKRTGEENSSNRVGDEIPTEITTPGDKIPAITLTNGDCTLKKSDATDDNNKGNNTTVTASSRVLRRKRTVVPVKADTSGQNNERENTEKAMISISAKEEQNLSKKDLTCLPDDLFTSGQVVNTMIHLNLQQNKLSCIPEDISLCSRLVILNLSFNKITKLPHDIGNLYSLQKLNLSGNPFIKLPQELQRLSKLQKLILSQNRYTEIPEEIYLIFNLKKLILSRNKITKVSSKISVMIQLQNLDVSFNQITQVSRAIGSCIKLKHIDFRHNLLEALPNEICRLNLLETVVFLNNRLQALPPHFKLSYFPDLTLLDFQQNYIERLPDDFFWGTSKFFELYASHNKLKSFPRSVCNCVSIGILELHSNQLDEVPSIMNLTNLTVLNLGNNSLKHCPTGLENCISLQKLNLFGNEIAHIPDAVYNFSGLKYLYLAYNKLSQFDYLRKGRSEKLKHLIISGNPITDINISSDLSFSWKLTFLYLNNMNLTTVPKQIGDLYKLQQLDLSHNYLTSIPIRLRYLTSLYSLDLSHNNLINTPSLLENESDENTKKWDKVNWWQELETIGIIDLSFNQLEVIPVGLQDLMEIESIEVRFDHNPIGHKPELFNNFLITRPMGNFEVGWSELVGKRPTQEDVFCICGQIGEPKHNIHLFGLFDGHASRAAAHFAATNFIKHLLQKTPFHNAESVIKALVDTFHSLNDAWYQSLFSTNGTFNKVDYFCGSTGVVVLIYNGQIYAANVGDSRVVLYRGDTQSENVVRLTKDHKPEVEEEEIRIREAGGYVIENRIGGILGISRCLGDFYLSPYVIADAYVSSHVLPVQSDSFILMCCDGVWDELSDSDAVSIVRKSMQSNQSNLHKVANKLRDYSFLMGSDDNISAMIIKI